MLRFKWIKLTGQSARTYPQPRRDETGNEVSAMMTTLELRTRKLTEIRI
jgi:hypothetical protein